jgi:hypothetical protein
MIQCSTVNRGAGFVKDLTRPMICPELAPGRGAFAGNSLRPARGVIEVCIF